ncbi:DNA cytosine methyltransferase [Guyparkeria halophila]|uniref:DNA (cytosine-5-)-methyltransferase n=1 Tax=Guyparkeria halophila TaxID=47960 RepID=A0ABZ0YW29_9GAMM|nr:DNA cytosine methyltransferase [Guyparkeria halophila]WQH16390.1 DNA cytosine methyltransferase [Guyparkeria halophila]
MAKNAEISVVSLYSGAGGLDLGFSRCGLETAVAFERGSAELKTYRSNFPGTYAYQIDLGEASPAVVAELVERHVSPGSNLVVIGGPPCQSFSVSNVSPKIDEKRASLVDSYAAIIEALLCRFRVLGFVFENVPGLREVRKHRYRYARLKWRLYRAGFSQHEKIHQALDYGVPQNRRRLMLLGFHKKFAPGAVRRYLVPAPTVSRPSLVRDAIANLPEPTFFRRNLSASDIPFHPNHWTMVPRSQKFATNHGPNLKRRSFKQLSWDLPSPAVAYGNREIHVHPDGHRRLSIYEAMRLQGFPLDFVVKGNFSEQVTQVSNAVPIPLAASVANSFYAAVREPLTGSSRYPICELSAVGA